MDLAKEYILSQYQELGMLNENECVRIVRNSITGKIAVKKSMGIEQKPVYDFLKSHKSDFIPEIYECVENGRQLIVIEEYFEGRNLGDILYDREMSQEECCGIVADLCRALEPFHTAEPAIVCRDLKPENIMVTPQNHVKLVDFDIARVVRPGKNRDTVVMGTEGFAAPEQFGHRQTDGRSDIYALGTVLNYCILRKFPVEEIVDGELGDVVRKCIAVNPDERYQSVRELEDALEKLGFCEMREAGSEENGVPKWDFHREPDGDAEEETVESAAWRRFLPPGFRSGKIWKMVVAVMGYLMVIYLSLTLEVKVEGVVVSDGRALLEQVLFLLSQLAEIAVVFNYMGCQDEIPFLKYVDWRLRIGIYIALEFILVTIAVFLCVVLESLFW